VMPSRRRGCIARPKARRSRSEGQEDISMLEAVATGVRYGFLMFALLFMAFSSVTPVVSYR